MRLQLHGITAPEQYGGLGLGYLEHCVAMEKVASGRLLTLVYSLRDGTIRIISARGAEPFEHRADP
jgi:alkylation response protein AidB-like acyl-CoA dehydrogenase